MHNMSLFTRTEVMPTTNSPFDRDLTNFICTE
jgi:hypothetical protein